MRIQISSILTCLFILCFTLPIQSQFYEESIFPAVSSINNSSPASVAECYCNLEGTYTAVTSSSTWPACGSDVWEGEVIIQKEPGEDEVYAIFTVSEGNTNLDMSIGAYYICYGLDATLPGGDLRLTNNCGLGYSGLSLWGEEYTVLEQEFSGNQLTISWMNDYDEGATTVLTRTDNQIWDDLACEICYVCSPQDSLALVALYNATDGANWRTPWDLTEPVEFWHGVTLNEDCCVSSIILNADASGDRGNDLNGTLPNELSNLASLEVLDLAFNEGLSGTLPSNYGNLINLRILRFFLCSLTGSIPPELGNLENLETLSLTANQMTGPLPTELGNLSNLSRMFCSFNAFTGSIPSSFGNLTNSLFLSLNTNQLSGTIPTELTNLTNLILLRLDRNNLSGEIPAGFANVNELITLEFSENELTGPIPDDLGNIENLTIFKAYANQLTGEVPMSLLENEQLSLLYIHDNDLQGCYEGMDSLCLMDQHSMPSDTFNYLGDEYVFYGLDGYSLNRNPKMPWEGNLIPWCEGDDQIGAPCDDGVYNTINDVIDADCNCAGIFSSVSDIDGLSNFLVSPNPSSAKQQININLQFTNSRPLTLKLYNTLGHMVQSKAFRSSAGPQNVSFDLLNIAAGIYLLELSDGKGIKVERLVVQ